MGLNFYDFPWFKPKVRGALKHTVNPLIFPGFINCHVRDAAALCSYFAWLEKEIPTGTVTEISGADKLASLRGEMENFVGLSFDTISSVGPNGAIIHYKPSAGKYDKIFYRFLYRFLNPIFFFQFVL